MSLRFLAGMKKQRLHSPQRASSCWDCHFKEDLGITDKRSEKCEIHLVVISSVGA